MRTRHEWIFLAPVLAALAGSATTLDWTAAGGSRADGVVRLSCEYGELQLPRLDEGQAVALATRHCRAWGYSGSAGLRGPDPPVHRTRRLHHRLRAVGGHQGLPVHRSGGAERRSGGATRYGPPGRGPVDAPAAAGSGPSARGAPAGGGTRPAAECRRG